MQKAAQVSPTQWLYSLSRMPMAVPYTASLLTTLFHHAPPSLALPSSNTRCWAQHSDNYYRSILMNTPIFVESFLISCILIFIYIFVLIFIPDAALASAPSDQPHDPRPRTAVAVASGGVPRALAGRQGIRHPSTVGA